MIRNRSCRVSGPDVCAMWLRSIHIYSLDLYVSIQVAGDALSKAIAQQRERRARGGAQQFATQQPATRPQRAAEAEDLPSSRSLAIQHKDALVFGAVYEHCDSTGRPQIISSTSVLPEQQFLEVGVLAPTSLLFICLMYCKLSHFAPDPRACTCYQDGQSHRSVADLLTRGRGSSKVVWAGVGQRVAGVGDIEMTAIREAIVEDRSKRLQVQKLSGVKPYSKHGF